MPASRRGLDRVLGQHVRDREVLADVAQELEQRPPRRASRGCRPSAPGRAGREVEEALELGPDRGGVGARSVAIEQVALGRLAGRVADHARCPPPTTTTGPPPWRWRCISPKTCTRCPTWSDGPLGSKPLYPLIGRPRRSRAARPGSVLEQSPPLELGQQPARIEVARLGDVTACRAGSSQRPDRGAPSIDRPYAIVAASMQTSLARRRRHRRNGATAQERRRGLQGRHRASPVPLRDLRPPRPRAAPRPQSARTATTARACRTRASSSTRSNSPSRRSSTIGPARSSWPASARSSATW